MIDHLKATGLGNKDARDALATGKVRLGGVPVADPGREIDPARVEIVPNAPRLRVGRDLVVVHRDPHLAVIWKPSGMLAVPAVRRKETNVLAEVGRLFGSTLAVHRLDEGTSGLMLVAFDPSVQFELKALFERHAIERSYLALGWGTLRAQTVRSTMIRDRGDGRRGSGSGPDAKEAVTDLEPLERVGPATLFRATLETGRTHQVRIHAAESGCPLLGDQLYAPPHVARRGPRIALHAAVLGFEHPVTRVALRFEAPLADDLEHLRRTLAG